MLMLVIEADGQAPRRVSIEQLPCRIGRRRDNAVVLDSWRVARVHAEIHAMEHGVRLVDAGALTGTWVNGERIVEFGPVDPADEIVIGGFRLRVIAAVPAALLTPQAPEADAVSSTEEPCMSPLAGHASEPPRAEGAAPVDDPGRAWRVLLHHRLLQTIDLRRKDVRRLSAGQLRAEARALLEELIANEPAVPPTLDRARLIDETLDEVVGLGPLERLMADPLVSEIMVNSATEIFVERGGRLQPARCSFSSEAAVHAVIERIVAPLGRRIDESSPMVDARLPDGSRVNAVIPPLAVKGCALTIRRFGRQALRPEDLIRLGSADARMLGFLRQCIRARRNLVIAGGTGSGKTTLLNLLAGFIDPGERLVTIEDAAELSLDHPNLVRLEARPANAEGRGQVAIRDLVRNALRMRPDRIIVGECRGGEALDMLQAMNTGHEGSLTTVHANSARDAIARLETMVLMAGMDLPLPAVREQIASGIQIVVQQARAVDGSRRIVEISEITGSEGPRLLMQPIFRYRQGRFEDCGNMPQFYERIGLPPASFHAVERELP
ncbi:MAG: Flp pilus assembly complex ATPase component TadA [Betaproteobacteria bacterium]|nr:Flp pilus assembly complex ATPase component TadA [Betaproteobacteria bacterium]